jgi:hypothetical protein
MSNIFQQAFSTIIFNLNKSKKERAIRLYARRLIRLLQATYGKQEIYTTAQVKKTMKEWGYSTSYDCYGLAMYCDFEDFSDYHRSIGESCNYEAMRSEISYCLFSNDTTFSTSSLATTEFNFESHGHHHNSGSAHVEQHHHHQDYGGSADTGCQSSYDASSCSGGDFGGGSY